MAGQQLLPGMKAKLNAAQRAAETFVMADREANDAKERAKKRKEEMVQAAHAAGVTTIKFTDNEGWCHTFEIDAKVAVSHKAFQTVKVERIDEDERDK